MVSCILNTYWILNIIRNPLPDYHRTSILSSSDYYPGGRLEKGPRYIRYHNDHMIDSDVSEVGEQEDITLSQRYLMQIINMERSLLEAAFIGSASRSHDIFT